MSYSTDKICVQSLLLYTEHVFWFQLFVIDLIFWHVTFTTDYVGQVKCNWQVYRQKSLVLSLVLKIDKSLVLALALNLQSLVLALALKV